MFLYEHRNAIVLDYTMKRQSLCPCFSTLQASVDETADYPVVIGAGNSFGNQVCRLPASCSYRSVCSGTHERKPEDLGSCEIESEDHFEDAHTGLR